MDGAAAATITEDGATNKPSDGHRASENNVGPSAEDIASDGVGVFCCQDCGEAFREEAAYLEHRHQHLQENVHLGDQLDGLHDAEKDSETAHFCTSCSLSFVEMNEFLLHMETNHGQTSQKESGIQMNSGITRQHTYECQDCGKCYGVIGHFLNHQRSHRQASKSVFHDLEHLKKKSFQCESCGRNYSRASALDAHRRCHEEKLVKSRNRSSGDSFHTEEPVVEAKPPETQADDTSEKLFKCSCGKAFSALLRLKTHQRFSRNSQCSPEEMKEKPKKNCSEFYCSECKKSFNGHIALFNHQRWHANHSDDSAKRFPCEECGKVFMTLTFYYRHQRMAHSDETPAKSFLHQVCQLQKKSFECKDCGLKFSRASALHSHQLHHTDVFRETEKEAQMPTSLLPQQKSLESERKETEHLEEKMESEKVFPTSITEDDSQVNETDEDMESYEPGDFNVQVISASESEDEPVQDLNPDLELLCESDQEIRDDGDTEVSPSSLFSKPEMDLKIVQIDFEQVDEQCAQIARETENETTGERFDCPECYRWFSSASSLRVHRMWHGVHKRRQQTQGQSVAVYTCDTCGHEASSYAAHCSHIQQHNTQNTSNDALYQTEGSEKKNLTCSECGKCFSRLSALVSHQLHHPKRKQFQCPDCMMSYLHAASLFNHMKNCSAQKKENISVTKKEYNPKKTLLGPKIYHCEQCGKGFWSLGAYSHHKQNQTECADLRLRKGVAGSLHSVNGHPRSSIKVACPVCGRKFRHKGIMALHMRKHENGNHKCELCNRSFRLFSSLLRHQVVHNDQLLPPPIKSFQHQVEQLKKNTYSCPDCGKLFSRAKALQFHMKSHGYETGHSPSSPRSTVTLEDLQCATCLAHFNNKASLRAHQKLCMKRDSQAVDCKTEPVENNDTLTLHQDSMDVGKQESSEHLTLKTEVINETDSRELKTEDQTGATDLKYKCKKCDRSFSVVGALNFHKRVHSEGYKSVTKAKLAMSVMLKKPKQEEPSKGLFHCSECGRRFMSNSALGSHKRWHKEKKFSRSSLKDDDLKSVSHKTEDGPFQCNTCGKQFFNHCVLQRHQMFNRQCQTKTEPEPESSKSVGRNSTLTENSEFSCPGCNETFVQGSLLAAHHENEHSKILQAADHQGDDLVSVDQVPEQVDVGLNGSGSRSSTLKGKAHQCPLCSMTFAKARGLRAHKWQAHSNTTKGKNKVPLSTKKESIPMRSEVRNTEDSSDVDNTTVMSSYLVAKKNSPVDRGRKKIRSAPPPVKSVSCLDCGKQCSSAGALLDHKKVCLEVEQEAKQEIQTPEAAAEVSPPLSRLLEHTAKCLFKCDKCGKAFQTEEQLSTHKTKAKSRPYCCALCCHGFWTENQLQQHLAWHDEVRCRLPNEVRYRLSAAMTSKPLKSNIPSADNRGNSFQSSTPNRPTLNPDSQSQSSHKCQHCGKAFLSPTALQKHESQHCNNDSYHCSICPRTFSEIQDLIDHHQECIGDYKGQSDAPAAISPGDANGLTCLECGTTFCQETDLHQHYIEHAHGVF
ncbi:zinc finger protein 91-like isoform X1 [Seriola lalandi dorsalis]|uniref:zinc finger protein 91-like isoform X1 n=1 Tax=Seriola lalandi dorsalis TaxID=1841481 RepID=UPI000C6F98F7|nr:zinc finger protein 91-like isoform X1 [Seriola lalandi dorsalis]XP_023275560.1 zinc finger protein 91-like isoform X1 [Seriola lalandi dorsalis]